MVISQGEIWWADLGEPRGSAAGYRRPVGPRDFDLDGFDATVAVDHHVVAVPGRQRRQVGNLVQDPTGKAQ